MSTDSVLIKFRFEDDDAKRLKTIAINEYRTPTKQVIYWVMRELEKAKNQSNIWVLADETPMVHDHEPGLSLIGLFRTRDGALAYLKKYIDSDPLIWEDDGLVAHTKKGNYYSLTSQSLMENR